MNIRPFGCECPLYWNLMKTFYLCKVNAAKEINSNFEI